MNGPERAAVQALLDAYVASYNGGDADGCAACFELDAVLTSPYGAPALGRAAIAATHRDWLTEADGQKTMTVLRGACSGNTGWALARFADLSEAGLTLVALTRDPDAGWLIAGCALNEGDIAG